MAKKTIDDMDGGIGDVSDLFTDRSVSDLSWLNVDVEEYRKQEALPKQNLDTIPELVSALLGEPDERIPQLIPLKPFAIVNSNPLEAPQPTVRQAGSVKNRVAQYIMMGLDPRTAAQKLRAEFSPEQLEASSRDVNPLLEERGLLGNVYVDASHLPRCSQAGADRDLVRKHASRAIYVVAKSDCAGCVQNRDGVCSSLGKRIVDKMVYDSRTMAHYSAQLAAEGRAPSGDGKVHLRMAFLTPPPTHRADPVLTIRTQQPAKKPNVTDADIDAFVARRSISAHGPALPSGAYLAAARQMMEGKVKPEHVAASADPDVRGLVREYGLLGHSWIDADALGGPRQAASFLKSTGIRPDYVVCRVATSEDVASGATVELSKIAKVVTEKLPVDRGTFLLSVQRAVLEDRLTREQALTIASNAKEGCDWIKLTAQMNLYSPPAEPSPGPARPAVALRLHHGDPGRGLQAAQMDPEEVRRSISHMMNSGLRGRKLQASILARYTREDLSQLPEVGARLSSLDGVQGDYFIDPTAYSDYGLGCRRGSEQFRNRGAKNIIAGDKCTGCVLQAAPGWCSRYAKNIVRNIPSEVLAAAAEKRRLPVVQHAPVEQNIVQKFGLASDDMSFEVPEKPAPRPDVTVVSPGIRD